MTEQPRSNPDNETPQPEPQPDKPSVISELHRQAEENLAAIRAKNEGKKPEKTGSDTVELSVEKHASPGDTTKTSAGESKPAFSTEIVPPPSPRGEASRPGEDEISPDENTIDVKFWPAGTKEPEDDVSRETLRLTHEKNEDAPTIPKEYVLSPEQIAEKKFREEYPEEREKQMIEEGIRQKMSEPSFRTACEANIIRDVMASVDLSDGERQNLAEGRQFSVRGFLGIRGAASIYARDLAGLIAGGMSITDIRDIKRTFFDDVVLRGKIMSQEDFEKLVDGSFENRMKQIAENEVKQEFGRRKDKWVEEMILHDRAEQEQAKATAAEEKRKTDAEEKNRQRVESSEALSPEEKSEKVKRAAYLWQQTYKIDRMLREKKYTDKFGYRKKVDGEDKIFRGKEGKKEAKADKNEMSKELVALAQEISGRDFREDAKAIRKAWKKKDLEKYITDEVEKVLTENGITFTKEGPPKILSGFKAGQESLKTHDAGIDLDTLPPDDE